MVESSGGSLDELSVGRSLHHSSVGRALAVGLDDGYFLFEDVSSVVESHVVLVNKVLVLVVV